MLKKILTLITAFAVLATSGCGLVMNNEDRLDRAEAAIANGDYRAAIIDAKDVLTNEPENIRGRVLLGRASIQVGDASSAEKEFRRAIELGADLAVVAVDLGRAMVGLGQFDQAIDEITVELAASDQDFNNILQIRGEARLGLRQPEQARNVFAEILSADNANVDAQIGIVSSYLIERNYLQARATLDQVLAMSENAIEPWLVSGEMHFDRRNTQGAEKHFAKALGLANSQDDFVAKARALAGLSEAQLAQDETELARENIQTLTVLTPNAPNAMHLSARIAYIDKDWERAQALLQEVLRRVPDYRPAQLLLGSVHLQNGNLEQAEMYLSAVVAASPNNENARGLLAHVRLQQQDTNAARVLLQPMIDGEVPNPNALALAAQVSADVGDLDQAAIYLQRRVEVSGGDSQARLDLAAIYLVTDRIEEAQAVLNAGDFADTDASSFRRDMISVILLVKSDELTSAREEARSLVEESPDNPRALSLLASVEMLAGDVSAARNSFNAALERSPDDLLPLRLLGALEEDEGNLAAAKDVYARFIEKAPNDVGILMALARVSARTGDLDRARHWLERSVAADPDNFNIRKTLSQLFLALGDFDSAQRFAEETIRLADDNADAHRVLGHALLNGDDFGAAEESFKRAISLDPSVSEYWLSLARTQIEAGDRDAALKTVADAYAENPGDIQIAALLTSVVANNGDLDAAMIIAKDLRRLQPYSATPIALEAEVLARRGDLVEAAALFDEAIEIENASRFAARAYELRKAAGLPNKDDPLLEHLEQNPLNTNVRLFLAQGYQVDGKNDDALREYQRVLEIAADDPIALNNIAWIYMESGDSRAEEYARRAYMTAPENRQVMDTLGWILVQKGAVDEGAKILRSAAEQSPDLPEVQYHLAAAMIKQGLHDDARQILETVLREGGAFTSREAAEELLLQL